jgi:hypothetical protein
MRSDSASIFITKLGAAERQLNAAIRLLLAEEDELAIHTIAASAYRVIREIKEERRGRGDSHDLFLRGLFAMADDLANGRIDKIPDIFAYPQSQLPSVIDSIRVAILRGEVKTFEDIPAIRTPTGFWKEYNKPFNFLKHAKDDPEDVLSLDKLKNDDLLMRASAALYEITSRQTPEIEIYWIYSCGHLEGTWLPDSFRAQLASLSPAQKRRKCRMWLRNLKANGSSPIA